MLVALNRECLLQLFSVPLVLECMREDSNMKESYSEGSFCIPFVRLIFCWQINAYIAITIVAFISEPSKQFASKTAFPMFYDRIEERIKDTN